MSMKSGSEFQGRIAIVTGAAQGIGLAIADLLNELGAFVIALDIQYENTQLQQVNITADDEAPRWSAHLDVSNREEVEERIAEIENQFGSIDYLVHAVGILCLGDVNDISAENWLRTFEVNTHGAFYVFSAAARSMRKNQSGAMVVIGSNAYSTPRLGMGAYAASKAATTMMLKCLGLELAQYNIRCNIVAPGSTDTMMQQKLWTNENGKQHVISGSGEQFRLGIPLQRIAKPQDIANTTIFLLSDLSSHLTMEVIKVDGGATLGCY